MKLSIVIPIYNEEENIDNLLQRLTSVATKLKHFDDYEIVAVNDGSKDRSLQKLSEIATINQHLKVVSFTRNFGQEPATIAGVRNATGDAVAIMDADLQDPPELLFQFEEVLHEGYDIAFGQRPKRLDETFLKKFTSKLFYPIFRWFTKVDVPRDIGNCCMMSSRATKAFKNLSERSPFIRAMIFWSGLPKKAVIFLRQKRAAGTTKYNYMKLIRYAIDNIILFSTTPLYFLVFFAGFTSIACVLGTFIALIMKLNGLVVMTGWTSLIISQLFLFSITIFSLGLIGLYIGKIFEEVKARPLYIIDKVINFDVVSKVATEKSSHQQIM
jgi:dolichol-phosphate mannosyltransferase